MKREKLFLFNATQFDESVILCYSKYGKSQCIFKYFISWKQLFDAKKRDTDILSKADILTKPTKTLVIIANSLYTRSLLKKIYMGSKHSQWYNLLSSCLHMFAFRWNPSPLRANLKIECPLCGVLDLLNIFVRF